MSEEFGKLEIADTGHVRVSPPIGSTITLSLLDVQRLRDHFQHERDEALGRWRYPSDPRYVVYGGYSPGEEVRLARVVNEQMGISSLVYEGISNRSDVTEIGDAYFDAHPERKPWDEANEGDIWALSFETGSTSAWVRGAGHWHLPYNTEAKLHEPGFPITSARRIWPEDAS